MKLIIPVIIVSVLLLTSIFLKGQDASTRTTKAFNEWSYTFFIWQEMHAKRKQGTIDYQEILQWDRVRKAWERFDKAVMEEYKE